jgi:hypothetical protein
MDLGHLNSFRISDFRFWVLFFFGCGRRPPQETETMKVLTSSIGMVAILATAGIARAQQQPELPAEATKVLQYLEGTWEFAGRIGDEKCSGTFSARWARGRYALITQDSLTVDGAPQPALSAGVIGWDPTRKQITHCGIGSDNGMFVNRWNVTATGEWVGQLTGTREGKEHADAFKITTEPDKFVIESKDAEGKEAEFVYKRLPGPKEGARKDKR